jgi:hypothetical protein
MLCSTYSHSIYNVLHKPKDTTPYMIRMRESPSLSWPGLQRVCWNCDQVPAFMQVTTSALLVLYPDTVHSSPP